MADDKDIGHVKVKIPTFMENSVSNWFIIAEAQFNLAKITISSTKFYHIIANLPTTVLDKLDKSTITDPDYDKLKLAIVDRYEKSKPELFRRILTSKTMTGKPSVYMHELQVIAEKVGVGDDFVKHQFLEAAPPSISSVLLSQNDLSLTQMGKLADSMLPYIKSTEVNAIESEYKSFPETPNQREKFPSSSYSQNSYRNNYRYDHNRNQDFPKVPFSVMPFSPGQRPKICRAHLYFLDDARTCKPWCGYPNKSRQIKILPNSRPSSPARPSPRRNNQENRPKPSNSEN